MMFLGCWLGFLVYLGLVVLLDWWIFNFLYAICNLGGVMFLGCWLGFGLNLGLGGAAGLLDLQFLI
ncbi:hypothetical protein [Neolewinella litorea]|uniref:Uncharacterized protein n=1 Tax=Neolewinella litorea TaxID=2562452 RepID=A0A4S4NIC8_9BACT|nr:hypothetical protein [Neolewinella litorea]THH39482.1 hypothetical protein E4021_12090 [Neolewinella litorea]